MYKTLSQVQNFNFVPMTSKKERGTSQNQFKYNSEWSSACSSSGMDHECHNDCHHDCNFNYDSEDAEVGNLVGQALMHCEATRGGKKKQFNNAEERIQFRQTYEAKKKTELCRNFEMYGTCRYGDTCSYAHGKHQLQKKTHLPSNFMTKLCIQFHEQGTCAYGERCQYLHSVYDLKNELTYVQALKEGARLTDLRNKQIDGKNMNADCLWANLKTSDGCGAPKKPRLAVFEQIYNKENYNAEIHDENFMKRSNSVSSIGYQSSSTDFSYQQQSMPQPMNYNYNNQYMNNNMGYQANYTQDNTQYQSYQGNQMYNNYNQPQYYNQYQNCRQQAFQPQANYQMNQSFNQMWA